MRDRLGGFKIISRLGFGAMGVVYLAHDEQLDRRVAIKVLAEHLFNEKSAVDRFILEARAIAKIGHPNVVQVFATGDEGGLPFFVMEFLDGSSLDKVLHKGGKYPRVPACELALQAARGLGASHAVGVIHRDVKPANLMLLKDGTLKITDFGISLPRDLARRLTSAGVVIGTPAYLAPEQWRLEEADERTDIYALGVTLFELLSGELPFREREQALTGIGARLHEVQSSFDVELSQIIGKMIARKREDRYQTCVEVRTALEAYLSSEHLREPQCEGCGRPLGPQRRSRFNICSNYPGCKQELETRAPSLSNGASQSAVDQRVSESQSSATGKEHPKRVADDGSENARPAVAALEQVLEGVAAPPGGSAAVRFLSVDELYDLDEKFSKRHGDRGFGNRPDFLRASEMPRFTVRGEEAYPSFSDKAAVLFWVLLQGQPLRYENYGLASLALHQFCRMNAAKLNRRLFNKRVADTIIGDVGDHWREPEAVLDAIRAVLRRAIHRT